MAPAFGRGYVSNVEIRPTTPADGGFVSQLSGEAFAPFGDYRELLPRWNGKPGVFTFLAVERRRPVGFVMVGFYWGDPERRTWVFADVLAIAVASGHRGRGIGRKLLRQAIEAACEARSALDVRELRLTVADTNGRAQALFRSEGFVLSEEGHGHYDGGQVALRMRKPLPTP